MTDDSLSDEKLVSDLLSAVNSAVQPMPHEFRKPAEVCPGQVRQLIAYDDNDDSALVLVLAVDETSATAKVASVSSPVINATYRDLLVDRSVSGFPFDFTIRSDAPANAWCVQLAGTPQVGTIDPRIVWLAARAPSLENSELAAASEEIGISVGQGHPRLGDHLWWSIGRSTEKLARLTAECHEAVVSAPVADPAILSALVLRSDESDKAAAKAMCDALETEAIEDSPEAWAALNEALSVRRVRDQDAIRLLERHFLEQILNDPDPLVQTGANKHIAEPESLELARDLPLGLSRDPLLQLLHRSARQGNRSTRIWTAHHLWSDPGVVIHAALGGSKHAVISEFTIEAEEASV